MKITTTMTRDQFALWVTSLRKTTEAEWNRVPVEAKAKAKLVRPTEAKDITMQEVMVSWTINDWKENK